MTDNNRATDVRSETTPRADGQSGPDTGRFDYDVATRTLEWSERTYAIYGFAPGDVVPTLDLMSRHVHQDDRERWNSSVGAALVRVGTFCEWHRVVDARRKVRTVVSVGHSTADAGTVAVLSGFVVDLTVSLRRHREQETNRAVVDAVATRDLIEQAKGMMMVIFDLSDAQAFDLLRWQSSRNNVKLRDVAATLVDGLTDPALAGTRPRERLTAILAGLKQPAPGARPVLPAPVAGAPAPADTPRVGGTSPGSRRISSADLPRTMVRAVSSAAVSITIVDWLDPEQPLVYVNDAFATLTGYASDEILGRNCRFLQASDSDQPGVTQMRAALDAGRDLRTVLRNYRKDGTLFWNEVHLSAVRDDTGQITHYIGYQSDVSERVERAEQLRSLAYRDATTDLPNAAAGAADLAAVIRSCAGAAFDVLCVRVGDADPAGTGSVAERLRPALPAGTCLSVRDDRSLLLRLPPGGSVTGALMTAVRKAVGGPVTVGLPTGPRPDAGPWMGIARYPRDGADAASLIRAATDAAHD